MKLISIQFITGDSVYSPSITSVWERSRAPVGPFPIQASGAPGVGSVHTIAVLSETAASVVHVGAQRDCAVARAHEL